jgi:RNA polymerase sigma-54 factor
MALGPRLDLRQSQSLVMTPQLQQAIKLLALSNLELEAYLHDAIESNPLLEAGSEASGGAGDDGAPDGAVDGAREGDAVQSTDDDRAPAADMALGGSADTAREMDVDYGAETFHHDSVSDSVGSGAGSGRGDDDGIDFDSFAAAAETLRDHLLAQAGETLSGAAWHIAVQLIEAIDEAGYLQTNLLDVANRLGEPLAAVEAALAMVQTFDPAGVGARDLSECLAIQAREADRYDPAMARLIDNLELVARGAVPQLKRLCGVDDEDIYDMIRELRGYDPKPGLRFGGTPADPVTPDLFVRRAGAGWIVEVNGATLPRVLVNRRYYQQLSGQSGGAGKAWLSDQLASANWLVRALDQRQRTIVKVASEIVKQQEGFFLHGVSAMKPLTLRAVADAIGMHESTVSRVTSNKYLFCPRGLFELKYFFSSGIGATSGEGGPVSAEAVKSRIKALIDGEDDKSILSDDAIAAILVKDGFDIARRTVVKYRESMGIGSSVQRRRQKALTG